MYPVCPHRNVPAAFQRFLGPDSGGIERFFPDERTQRTDGTLLIVRQQGRRAVTGALQGLKDAAAGVSQAVGEFNAGLSAAWTAGASLFALAASSVGKDAGALIRRTATTLFGSRPVRVPA